MVANEIGSLGSRARERTLRVFRIGMVFAGAIGGALLPSLDRAMTSAGPTELAARLGDGWFAIVVNAAYGTLAGWAVGALVAHFLSKR